MLATSALGAALAFTTPAMAQDATQQVTQPVTTQPAPTTTTTTTTTATPPAAATTDPAPTTDTTTATTTTEAPAKSAAPTATRTRTASSAAAAAAAARRAEAQSLARTLAARSAAKSAAASSTPAPATSATPAAETPPPVTAAAQPTPAPHAAKPASTSSNDTALEVGGGALALLALGGAAYAITRRRKSDEEVWADEDVAYHDDHVGEPVAAEPMELDRTVEAPTVAAAPVAGTIAASTPRHDPVRDERSGMLAPPMSAFAWSAAEPRHDDAAEPAMAGDDRHNGESWVERAKRGPTPDNPSLSLKKRLKRAAFFDQRERDVAEGNAVPVDADAGLPENLEHA